MNERLSTLLADRALVGLDAAEMAELASYGNVDAMSFELERAAAAVALVGFADQPLGQMPSRLRARLEQAAGLAGPPLALAPRTPTDVRAAGVAPTMPAAIPPMQPMVPMQHSMPPMHSMPPAPVVRLESRRASQAITIAGWLAAAACLALAIGAYVLRPRKEIVTVTVPGSVSAPPSVPQPPIEKPSVAREQLLARAGTTKVEWSKTKDPASRAASGDVVWNAAEQRGFMRFQGLAKNDRQAITYQLWIFDKSRDAKYPVDGGVFDIDDETGDVIVPIKAKLPVGEASLFAVTVEKPGGVVVSKRERIVVTAKI
jgi:hypothetical protein